MLFLNLAGIDAKVKSNIKETVKSQSIKKEALGIDISALICDMNSVVNDNFNQLNQKETEIKTISLIFTVLLRIRKRRPI